jgi:peptidoglycan hydrolase-like protein with peptidoglycan-binding domain
MEQHVRDLGSAELWHTSLERSRKRRVLAHDGRRRMARKKQASTAVTAAMLMTPVLQVGGAMAGSKGKSVVSQSSPANRAIDARTLDVELHEGDTGTRVAQLQQLLHIDADGIFGPQTAAAVRAFQGRAGLTVDGVVGQSTWQALLAGSGTRGAAADAIVDGKGYQVSVSRASKSEAQLAGAGKGPVAKIVLTKSTTSESSTKSGSTVPGSGVPEPSKGGRSSSGSGSGSGTRDNVGGPTPQGEQAVENETSSPPSSQQATDPPAGSRDRSRAP